MSLESHRLAVVLKCCPFSMKGETESQVQGGSPGQPPLVPMEGRKTSNTVAGSMDCVLGSCCALL